MAAWSRTLGWGFFLACSWTWCIGMFLPVLLLRDFGPWSFAVFAAPNVIGAAAMGWVLRSAGSAARLQQAHRPVVAAFSIVTVLQQLMALPVLLQGLPARAFADVPGGDGLVGAWLIGAGAAIWLLSRRLPLAGSAALWALSAGVLLWALSQGLSGPPAPPPALGPSQLAPLGLVCLLGFMCCPYLDATFLFARARCPGPSGTLAFVLGFGVFFLAMILGTLVYAPWMLLPPGDEARHLAQVGRWVLMLHIAPQLMFTIALHTRWLLETEAVDRWSLMVRALLALGVLATVAIVAIAMAADGRGGIDAREIVYRLFMAFYGLVFPAYVFICMLPHRGDAPDAWARPPDRVRVLAWLFAVGVAGPMYWMGFIERQTWWLAPGVGAVLLARLVASAFTGPPASATSEAPPAPSP